MRPSLQPSCHSTQPLFRSTAIPFNLDGTPPKKNGTVLRVIWIQSLVTVNLQLLVTVNLQLIVLKEASSGFEPLYTDLQSAA